MSLDTDAKALWDAMQTIKPAWDQLGEVTKGVWREKVLAGLTPADYRGPFPKVLDSDPPEVPLEPVVAPPGAETIESAPAEVPSADQTDPIELIEAEDSPRYFSQPQLF